MNPRDDQDDPATPTCWALSDGRVGIEIQALGLARALGTEPVNKRIKARGLWPLLPPRFWSSPLRLLATNSDPLAPPWPDLVVGCGRQAVGFNRAIRKAAGGTCFSVQIQDPKVSLSDFDVVVTPRHDGLRGANVIETLGSMHGLSEALLAEAAATFAPRFAHLPPRRIGVLVGGDSRTHKFTTENALTLASRLQAWTEAEPVGLIVTPSRRTGVEQVALLRRALGGLPAEVWDGRGDNPYRAMLALSDSFVVTSDSVNMACEAAFTGKPIHVAPVEGGTEKFARFHRAMAEAGITRPLDAPLEPWTYPPLRETERVAAEIRRRLAERRTEFRRPGPAAPGVDLPSRAG